MLLVLAGEGVRLPVCAAVKLRVPVVVCVLLFVPDGVAVPLFVPDGVAVPLFVPVCDLVPLFVHVCVPVPDFVPVRVSVGVPVCDFVPLAEREDVRVSVVVPVVDFDDVGDCVVLRVPLGLPDTVRRLVGEMVGDRDKETTGATVAALVGVPAGGVAVPVLVNAGVGDNAGVPVAAPLPVDPADGVASEVESGVVVLASLVVDEGELLPDNDPDGVTLPAGVNDGVDTADTLGVGVAAAVADRDTLEDGDTPNDRDKLAVDETEGVELATDVAELLADGDGGGEEDAAAVREATDVRVVDATADCDRAGDWVEAGVLEAAALTVGLVELAEASIPANTTPSMFTVPPDAEARGLGVNRTHKLAASSAPAPSAVLPGVVDPVERYTVEVPYEAPEGASTETLA